MKIINLLDLNVAEFNKLVALTKYEKIIPRKIKFLVAAESLHGTHISAYYIIDRETSKDTDEIIIEQFVCSLMGNWYEMCEKEKSVIISKSHLAEYICKIKENEIVTIREFIKNDYCGYAWYTKEKNTFIEVHKGGLPSVWNAESIPTHYILNDKSSITTKKIHKTEHYYVYDYVEKLWKKERLQHKEMVMLDEQNLCTIDSIFRRINPNRINMKMTWMMCDNRIIVFDIYIPIGIGVVE